MSDKTKGTKPLLSYFNLSDEYERKARYFPAILTIVVLLPAAFAIGIPLKSWLALLIMGTGASAVVGVGLSHLASAMGNQLQGSLWPRWPHDSPTHRRLHPSDTTSSRQQKQQWYAIIKDLTAIDIRATENEKEAEIEATINDVVSQIRSRLWKLPCAERLRLHNTDYGFARNFAGLRLIWVPATTLASLICWAMFFGVKADLIWCVISTCVAIFAYPLAFIIMPQFVRRKANHYADSFFDALRLLHESERSGDEV